MDRILRQLEGTEMYAPDGATTEGEVFYSGTGMGGGALIQVTREQLL